MLKFFQDVANSPGINSLIVLVGVWIAYSQLKSTRAAIRAQLESVKEQIKASREASVEQLEESRKIAKRTETAALLLQSRGDARLQSGCRAISKYYLTPGHNIRDLAEDLPEDHADYQIKHDVMYVLNHFENVAICINHGIYCDKMIVDAWRGLMIKMRQCSAPLIERLRQDLQNPRVLVNFTEFVDGIPRV